MGLFLGAAGVGFRSGALAGLGDAGGDLRPAMACSFAIMLDRSIKRILHSILTFERNA